MEFHTVFVIVSLNLAAAHQENVALKSFRAANQRFTCLFLSEIAKENVGQNVIISAFSVISPLAQISLGAGGKTKTEIQKAISLKNDEQLKQAINTSMTEVQSLQYGTLNLASKLFLSKNITVNPSFNDISRTIFKSEVENIDFSHSEEAASTINSWVESKTNKKIKNLVSNSSVANAELVLVNSIYFKGTWSDKFFERNTQDRPFHVDKNKVVQVPTMRLASTRFYGESKDLSAKLVELPYEGSEANFLIVMPDKVDGLPNLLKKLKDLKALPKAIDTMFTAYVDLQLPKFKVETSTDLKEILKKMGVKAIFNPKDADLSKLLQNRKNLAISSAIQKAFIEINENGTEAAAANAFIGVGSALPPPTKDLIIDKPFYFEVKAKDTTIFSGFVKNP